MSTISELRTSANRIANETVAGANTASRIGALYNGIIDFLDVLNNKEIDYDDSELRQAIANIDQAIADLDEVLASVARLANEERNRLNDLLDQLDTRVRDKVDAMLGDAAVIERHAAVIQQGLEGEIQWQASWNDNIEAYLQEAGIWARNGDVIKTQWTQIVQSVDSIQHTVAEVQQDLSGRPTSTQWSQITQKVNSIEQSVNALLYQGNITEALQSSISQSIDGKVASLNLETTYAKIDTERSKDIIEWMYSTLKNESSADRTFNQIVSAGKSGMQNGISEVRTYVEAVKHGDVLNYVAYSDLESKVNDSITGLYNKASADEASSTIFSQVKKDTQDIAAIVTSATGDSSSASIVTKFQNWKAGLIVRSEFNAAIAELVTHNELSGAVSGLVSKAYVDEAVTNLISRIGNSVSAVNLKATLERAYGELVTANNINNYTAAFVTESTFNTAVAKMVAKNDFTAAKIVAMVNDAGSSVQIEADHVDISAADLNIKASDVHFEAGDTFDWTVEKDGVTIFHLDSEGNLTISGNFYGGNLGGQVVIANNTKFYVNSNKYAIFSTTDSAYDGMLHLRCNGGRGLTVWGDPLNSKNPTGIDIQMQHGGNAITTWGGAEFMIPEGGHFYLTGNGTFSPECAVKNQTFELPKNPKYGSMYFCKGTLNGTIYVYTTDYPIVDADTNSIITEANSRRNFGDDSFMLVFFGSSWGLFKCWN